MTEEPPPNRPLVTFALFAYNEEQYIREAVRAAFSQTYEPLEIILSDDCSTDRTFDIMQTMAKSYVGPHTIRLNRNATNLNIGGHVARVSDIASGEIIIMAAGDDISREHRAEEHVKVYEMIPNAAAVFSDIYVFRDDGHAYDLKTWHSNKIAFIKKTALVLEGGGVSHGAAYSYRKKCFKNPYAYPIVYQSEDRLLPLRAGLIGDVVYLPKVLVNYRLRSCSVASRPDFEPAKSRTDYQEELVRTISAAQEIGAIRESEAQKLIRIALSNPPFWRKNICLYNRGGLFRMLSLAQRFKRNPIGLTRILWIRFLQHRPRSYL